MSSTHWSIRYALAMVVGLCALLAPAADVLSIGLIGPPHALIPGTDTGSPRITQVQTRADDVSPPMEFSLSHDQTLTTVDFVPDNDSAGARRVQSRASAARTLVRPGSPGTLTEATVAFVEPRGEHHHQLHSDLCGDNCPGSTSVDRTPGCGDGHHSSNSSCLGTSVDRTPGCDDRHHSSNSSCPGTSVDRTPGCDDRHHSSNSSCPGTRGDPPVKPPADPVVPPVHRADPVAPVVPPVHRADPVAPVVPPADPVSPVVVSPPAAPVVNTPVVLTPVAREDFFQLVPWFWPVIVALILLSVGLLILLVGLLIFRAVRDRQRQKWVRAHVRAVAGTAPGVGVEVMESRTDHSPPTCVVRLEPRADSGTQILEEVHQ
jgi:hypothetical protein